MADSFINIDLKGFDAWERKFKQLGKQGDDAMLKALTETVIEASSTMANATPVLTNRLRSSIHFETPKTKQYIYSDKQGRGFNGGFRFKPMGLATAFGTNVEYAQDANEHSSKPRFFEKGLAQAKAKLPERLRKNYEKIMR